MMLIHGRSFAYTLSMKLASLAMCSSFSGAKNGCIVVMRNHLPLLPIPYYDVWLNQLLTHSRDNLMII